VSLRLYDTATREVRDLVPVTPGKVGIYHCGLTVQSPPHVGHIRKEVVFDVLRRWLEHSGYEVTVIANLTDIDDKILVKADQSGIPWWAIAYLNERALHNAYDVLGCRPPDYEPRATGHIPEMLEMIEHLIAKGHAYVAEDGSGDVYFDVRSWPRYGELSRQNIDDMEPAADADPRGKRDPRDFALWKGHKPTEPATASWPAPYGRGRPGWHIECSAMAAKYLGTEFDIHGGGLDLRFPHHENELAQSRAVGQPFARMWVHNALVTTAGEKMSKSLGNSALVSEVVRRFRPIDVRYYLAAAHYRSVIEFSDEALADAAATFARIEGFVVRAAERLPASAPGDVLGQGFPGSIGSNQGTPDPTEGGRRGAVPAAFAEAMDDDLAVPAALAVLQEHIHEGNRLLALDDEAALSQVLGEVRAMLDVLGLDPLSEPWVSRSGRVDDRARTTLDVLVRAELDRREQSRVAKDFATADAIRDRLKAAGILVEDTPAGPRWTLAEDTD
jgi:cysteinyl-tRNA synthetase